LPLAESVLAELDVETDGGDPERAALLIVGWVCDMLEIETRKHSLE
jgi:hypothetical protein